MKKLLPIFFVILAFSCFTIAQTPTPTPTQTPSAAMDDRDVVKITTSLIQLDVTVTDKKGNPVTDLRRDEIEIFENGKRQDISDLSFVNGSRERSLDPGPRKASATAVPVPSTDSIKGPENVRRAIALVVDDLSLSFGSMDKVRRELRNFVNEQMQEGDLVAVMRTGAGVGFLSQFTSNKRQLLAAISNLQFNLAARPDIFEPITLSLKEEIKGQKSSDGTVKNYDAEITREKERDRETNSYRENIFQSGTLGAINFIIRGMKEMPGRKSILLLSDGFKMIDRNERGLQKETMANGGMRRLVEFANRSSVVIYTLDPRGLVIPMASGEDRVANSLWDEGRANELRDSQDGLIFLARETGGLSFINQNNLSNGIAKVLDDQSYYLVSYEPDDSTFDATSRRFNKVTVKVSRPGVDVRYRSGFFGVSDEEKTDPSATTRNLAEVLMSPFVEQEMSLRLNPVFVAGENDAHYVRSYLHLNAGDLTFVKDPDNSYRSVFEIAGVSLGENGGTNDLSVKQFTLSIKKDAYDRMMKKGIVYEFTQFVKKPGPLHYRVAVRDVATGKVGSANQFIDLPNLKRDKLAISGIIFMDLTRSGKETLDPVRDTALRRFTNGAVVRYAANIYNAKVSGAAKPELYVTAKVYKDGVLIYTSPSKAIGSTEYDPTTGPQTTGILRVNDSMSVGEYFLQIIVSDKNARGSSSVASQFVAFEVVNADN